MLAVIPVDLIEVGRRLRGLSDAQIALLASSISDVGLMNPITVYARPVIRNGISVDGYGLIAGAHRLAACRSLDLVEVAANIVAMSELERQIAECDENLCSTVLTPAEKAMFTVRRKEAYEALHPETKNGVIGAIARHASANLADASFTSDTADKTGQSHRAIQRDASRGKKISARALEALRGTDLDKGVYLDRLKQIPDEDEQVRLVERDLAAKRNLSANIGAKSATKEERGNNLYETPIEAVRSLLALERFSKQIWEPACGRGAISAPLAEAGYGLILSDLIDYGTANADGEVQEVSDFLKTTRVEDGIRGDWRGAIPVHADCRPDIVTNPPYGDVLNGFVAHALREHRPRKMALLLNLNFLCGFEDTDRCFAMDENPPARVHVFSRRLPMMHRDGWDGPHASSSMNTAWFVWELDRHGHYSGRCEVNRVNWADYQDKPALAPRAERAAPKPLNDGLIDALISKEAARAAAKRANGARHD